jgi:zinc/manganese transport system substrate-binding protein
MAVLAAPAAALTVFACEPEWAALARVLVPNALVHVATTAQQDPHHIEARPALIAQLRSADVAVCTGAELEAGWLPVLQQRAGNPKVQDGAPGMFYAAEQVSLIDPGAASGPFAGDVHPGGNPHLQLDPQRLLLVASALAQRLAALLPAQRAEIAQRRAQFESRWKQRTAEWEQRAAPLRGRSVAAQHATFGYLWRWLGITQAVDLEPKPGMAPTPVHLQRVLGVLRERPPLAIVVAQHQDPRPARWLAGQLGPAARVLVLPATVVGDAAAPDALEKWFDGLVEALLQAPR